MIRRLLLASSLVLSLAWVATPVASAEEGTSVRIAQPVMRDCAGELLPPGTAGSARSSFTAPAGGLFTARLGGDHDPDWDLALFRGGETVAASTAFGSIEQASVLVAAGDEIVAQACRRDGRRSEVPLTLTLQEVPEVSPERISLESVMIDGPDEIARLEQLGVDVTHDVSSTDATVVLYSSAERALLGSAGFTTRTLIPDLAAADRTDRRAEARAAAGARSDLPSGRDAYRVYEDFTSELKALADENPAVVRPITLGTTFEGRPIEGVEIAEGVLRRDDGRPVYVNFGAHHAREWPSAEFPMEFAHSLVQGYNANDARIRNLLEEVRIVIVPVVNADGFIASRSHGTSPLDDDPDATLPQIAAGVGAYRRKNCRPISPGEAAIPCAQRGSSGIDLNRNYGYYWGGPGSSSDPTSQAYRGTGPFSEPESEAVHQFSSSIHPTVFISNHTFTDSGWWLRQPGFNAAFFPQEAPGYSPGCDSNPATTDCSVVPDEPAMKALGDAMGDAGTGDPELGATGWPSDLGWELGDITGATEDWNYFAQGTYGYTPEARGPNFHANYMEMVVTEYLGDQFHPGEGVREAYLIAGEEAGNQANHGVISGTVPPGATLKLRKEFDAPRYPNAGNPNGDPPTHEVLETTLRGSASGNYEWHVMPSDRPQIPNSPRPAGDEQWTMTCQRPGSPDPPFTTTVEITRNEIKTVDWANACGPDTGPAAPVAEFTPTPAAPLVGQRVNFFDASTDPDGAIAVTEWDLDDDGQFDDATGLVASRTFETAGSFDVSLRVTDDEGITDTETKTILVSSPAPPQAVQPAALGASPAPCRGATPTIVGTAGDDVLRGTSGDDLFSGLAGDDRILGLGGDDTVCGSLGEDKINGGSGDDTLMGNKGDDRLRGGGGADLLGGGQGDDVVAGGAGKDRCSGGFGANRLSRCP